MSADVIIRGANQLAELSAAIKRTGNGGLRRELLRGIQSAGKPLKAAAQDAVVQNLPKSGGANEFVASRTKVGIRTRTSGRSPGVRVIARSKTDLASMDRGILRHPVWGNRERWATTQISVGWWERRMTREAPAVRGQIVRSMNRVADRVAHYG